MTTGNATGGSSRRSNIPLLTAAYLAAGTTGGTTYAFGLYGEALKQSLHLSQSQLDTISSANFCAGLLSWIPGLVVDRKGPKFALWFGGILSAASLLCYWIVAREFVQLHHVLIVPTLCTLGVLIFSSSALITGAVFKIIVGTCGSGTKGSAVGAAKGYVGLGSGAYACMFESLALGSDLDFLPMAAFFSIAAVTVPAIFMLPDKKHMVFDTSYDRITPLHLRLLYASLIGLAMLVIGTSISELHSVTPKEDEEEEEERTLDRMGPHYGRALLTMSFWFAPIVALLFVPTKDDDQVAVDEEEDEEHVAMSCNQSEAVDPLSNSEHEEETGALQQHLSIEESEKPPTDRNLFEMLQTGTAWLFVWTSVILVGGGTLMTNNMGEMVAALRFSPIATPASLSLFSVAQSGGRVITGILSEWALALNVTRCGIARGVPRPAFLIIASLVGVAAHLLLSVATTEGPFVLGVALSGAAFGMVWPLMVLIIGEVFGTANVGANYMFYDGFSSAMGTLLLSKFVAQTVYESHIDHSDANSDNRTCYGQDCFRASQLIVAGLSLSCVISSIGMLRTTRQTYDSAAQAVSYEALDTSEHEKGGKTTSGR